MKYLSVVMSLWLVSTSGYASTEALEEQLLDEFLNYSLDCSTPIPRIQSTYQGYQTLKRVHRYQLNHKVLPIEVGSSSIQGGGLLLFTTHPLQGYVLGGGSSVLDIYSTADLKQLAVLHMVTSEGPGPLELTLINTNNATPQLHCITLDTPKELNAGGWKMEYSLPLSFNINELGKGILYTHADIDDAMGQSKTLWFAYYTQDGGKTWSAPESLVQAPSSAAKGLYSKATDMP